MGCLMCKMGNHKGACKDTGHRAPPPHTAAAELGQGVQVSELGYF